MLKLNKIQKNSSNSQKHWIGGAAIPISAVLLSGKVEGQVTLKIPPLLMGYLLGTDGISSTANPTIDLYVNIDTSFSKPETNKTEVNLTFTKNFTLRL